MPFTVWLGARWQSAVSKFWAEAMVGLVDEQDKLSTRDASDTDRIPAGGTPGFTTFTLRGGWRVSDSVGLSASLANLFDANYRIHGSGLNEAGTNLTVSVIWSP
jgi:hemoglobin/transferrin/lactoferrin receptor protein